jgi:HSP20 family protein
MSGKRKAGDVRADLGLGEILKGLGGFIELLGEVGEGKEIRRSGQLKGSLGQLRGLYGVSIKSGLGGVPVVEQFGNIRPTPEGPEVSDVREPLADIFDEAGHISVVVELPGVTDDEIKIEVEGDILTLEATGRDRRYAKELLLPAQVDAASLHRHFQNAILEIRLEKKK